MNRRSACLAFLAMSFAAEQASAQADEVVLNGTVLTCSSSTPKASYGPMRTFDGVMFSFIDGVLFTPCENARQCGPETKGQSLDLEAREEAWERMGENGFQGWGYYRLRFRGRQGRYDTTRFCSLGSQDFYEIDRVLSVKRIPDPRYP